MWIYRPLRLRKRLSAVHRFLHMVAERLALLCCFFVSGGLQSIATYFIDWWNTFCLLDLQIAWTSKTWFSGERVSALVMTCGPWNSSDGTAAGSRGYESCQWSSWVQQAQAKAGALSSSSATLSTNVDWSKLVNKPQVFDHASLEAEIKAFRDWSWQLGQFLTAIDPS